MFTVSGNYLSFDLRIEHARRQRFPKLRSKHKFNGPLGWAGWDASLGSKALLNTYHAS